MSPTEAHDVLLYIPNLIGYGRVTCSISSFTLLLWPSSPSSWLPWLGLGLYLANFAGDLVDGVAARRYNQTSQYGGVLDMVTDRCSTVGLLLCLVWNLGKATSTGGSSSLVDEVVFPVVILGLVLLDVSSHWFQMYSTLLGGQLHHKSDEGNLGRNFLVRWFYKYYWFFGYLCVGAELTYILAWVHLLLKRQNPHIEPFFLWIGWSVCLPACVLKQLVNIAQLCSAAHAIADHDAQRKNKSMDAKQK